MLNKIQSSISKVIRRAVSPEFANIASLDERVELLNTSVQTSNVQVQSLERDMEILKLLSGKILTNQMKQHGVYDTIQEAEFSVFSQFGDDGIIQYLIHQIKPECQ